MSFTNYLAAFLEISSSGQDVSVYRMVIVITAALILMKNIDLSDRNELIKKRKSAQAKRYTSKIWRAKHSYL